MKELFIKEEILAILSLHNGTNPEDEIRLMGMFEDENDVSINDVRNSISELVKEELIYVCGRWSGNSNEPETDWYALTKKGKEAWEQIEKLQEKR
ncbi:MAG: hypothetical protein FWE16_04965 [Firmicutes bacterium]|nr:hypothetical protein [Bacillota bacterium]